MPHPCPLDLLYNSSINSAIFDVLMWPKLHSGFSPLFVTWKKIVNGGEPRLRGCIGTLEARYIIDGFKDYALTR